MSKTITLETAKKLKAAFDKAGIEVPWTEKYWADNVTYRSGRLPDAEELGEWLPSEWFIEDRGGGFDLNIICMSKNGWNAHYSGGTWIEIGSVNDHPTIAEALAHLMIECLRVDPGQIKKHLEGLK